MPLKNKNIMAANTTITESSGDVSNTAGTIVGTTLGIIVWILIVYCICFRCWRTKVITNTTVIHNYHTVPQKNEDKEEGTTNVKSIFYDRDLGKSLLLGSQAALV